ncbi:MAG TPA: indolepyruvate oxidoreductase subunit beta family protein [Acetobacteraceae bacterium]|nr:indolepyruvate oxidoreductase subunit beta family protein [Acetobacteraceae bacterium]
MPEALLQRDAAIGARALTVAILAMGGEGGGVLADWLLEAAENSGFVGQSTSVPGVAQRTGATIYYLEFFPLAEAAGQQPVLALMPAPGDVDLVIASELMEAGRAIQRGLVSPERSTFIFSTHRVFAMTEKIAMGDGRVDADTLLATCRGAARQVVATDMQALAEAHGAHLSAVLLGAVAGSGALPLPREAFEASIRHAGVGVEASLAAFGAGFEASASEGTVESKDLPLALWEGGGGTGSRTSNPSSEGPLPATPSRKGGLPSLSPATADAIIAEGERRLIDYQDAAYARLYRDRLNRLNLSGELLQETARHLALWMSYEDTIRVADLKTRASRLARVRAEVRVKPDQVLRVTEFMHPRVQEVADTLPAPLGRFLLRSGPLRRFVERMTARGRHIETTSVGGFLLLRVIASLRRIRRATLRYVEEQERIEAWLGRIAAVKDRDADLALAIARCQRLVKGYGDTHARGWANFQCVMAQADRLADTPGAAARVTALCDAALADESGHALTKALEAA